MGIVVFTDKFLEGVPGNMWDFTASYDLFVFLIRPEVPPPWSAEKWRGIVSEMELLADPQLLKAAGIRSLQHEIEPYRNVSFGALNWNEKSHTKWTHTAETRTVFVHAELWAPRWTICEREDQPPQIFMAMAAKRLHGPIGSCAALIVAFDRRGRWPRLDAFSARLAGLLDSSYAGHCVRPWGLTSGSIGYTDGIQDLMSTGLLTHGLRDVSTLDQRILRGTWKPIGHERGTDSVSG